MLFRSWLLIGVQGCRLPGLKPSKRSKSPPSSAGKRYPNKPNTRHSRTQKPPQGHSNGSRAPHGRSNGLFSRRSRLPFARPQTQKFAQLRREKVPQQAQHAPRPQAKATTRPQQWLKGTPRPQQWLLIEVQVCHLPGLKPSKPSKSFKLIRVHLAAGCNFSLLEKQTAICLSCCPSPSLSLQYPPSN